MKEKEVFEFLKDILDSDDWEDFQKNEIDFMTEKNNTPLS
jgi:hypothetical protein